MADWLHCNQCYLQPGGGKKFELTNCGHIFCDDCLKSGSREHCRMCKHSFTSIPLTAKMKPDVQIYFTDPAMLVKKSLNQVIQALDFQRNHRQQLLAHHRNKLVTHSQLMSRSQEVYQKAQTLEREVLALKQENANLKKMINSGSSSTGYGEGAAQKVRDLGMQSRSPYHSRSSPMYTDSPTNASPTYKRSSVTSTTHLNAVPHYVRSPDSSVSPSQSGERSSVRQGRVTVRTPPSDGRMGPIVGSPLAPPNSQSASPMSNTPKNRSPSNFLRLHPGENPNNPLKPLTPGTPVAITMLKQGYMTPDNRRPIQLQYNPMASMSARSQSQGIGQKAKHRICIQNIKKLKQDNNILLEQTVKLKKNLQRLLFKESSDKTKFEEAREEVKLLKKMLDTETSKEEKLKDLHQQLEQLMKEKEELQNEKAQLSESSAVKDEEITQLKSKIEEINAEAKTWEETCRSLTEKSEQLNEHNQTLVEEKNQLDVKVTELQSQVSHLAEKAETFELDQMQRSREREIELDQDNQKVLDTSTPIRRQSRTPYKVPKAVIFKMTPRLGDVRGFSGSGALKRAFSEMQQSSESDEDVLPISRTRRDSPSSNASTADEGDNFNFRPMSCKRRKGRTKRKKTAFNLCD